MMFWMTAPALVIEAKILLKRSGKRLQRKARAAGNAKKNNY